MTPPEQTSAAYGSTRVQNGASERGRANGERGKRAERALVTWLRAHGWPHAERTVRTGHRVEGRTFVDRGDVDGTPGVVWQVKDVADKQLCRVPLWMDDVDEQRLAAGAEVGVLVVKRRGHADPGAWWAWVTLWDLLWCTVARNPALDLPDMAPVHYTPVRLAVADLATQLRAGGYGTQVDA